MEWIISIYWFQRCIQNRILSYLREVLKIDTENRGIKFCMSKEVGVWILQLNHSRNSNVVFELLSFYIIDLMLDRTLFEVDENFYKEYQAL